jgi:GntR family transcriptional regulator, transcriptional repressor for pyruvate dehydrogenase complex
MKDASEQDERAAGGEGSRAKPGLADRVYHLLYSRISNGDYPANQKLPSEKVLADELGVSRPILRIALERLRDQGLVHSRQGAGSYVREVRTVPLGFARVETIADIQRCYEFRICIETMAARLASARRDDASLAEVATALSLMEGATESQTHREDADFAFHLAVARSANNQYFEASMRALREHIYVGMKLHGQSLMTDGATALRDVFAEHSAIFDAIRDQDGDAAERLMRSHLTHSRERLFGGALIDLSRRG